MEGGTGIKVPWFGERNSTNTALRNTIWPKHTSNEIFASWVNPIKTGHGNGAKRPKTHPSETTPYWESLSTSIVLRA